VQAPGCTGLERDTLELALMDADAAAGEDRIEVGPGEYVGPFTGADAVAIVGAGRGKTMLTAASGSAVLSLSAPESSVSGLTARLGGAGAMTGIRAPRAEDVAIEGTAAPATGFSGGVLEGVTIDLRDANDAVGISASGALAADDVVIRLGGGALSTGVAVGPPATTASATLRHITIDGTGAGIGLAVRGGPSPPTDATALLNDSLITGVGRHIVTEGGQVTTSRSAYDPATITSTGPGGVSVATDTPAPVSGDPKLFGDLRPRHDSPLIDAADPAGSGTADASGAPRVVDGDGDGDARSDIGALEYQRRAPVISGAAATPAKALAGVPIAFSATASDPDGEAVSAAWTFSDGATATGFDVMHAFAAPGPASAQLRVTDAAGVAETTSVAVTIDPAPASVEPPATESPAMVTRRSVIARVLPTAVKLRAVARRDRRPPFRFRLRGRVVLPEGISAAGCRGGLVRLAIRAGKRRTTRSAQLAPDCRFRLTLKLRGKRARRVVVKPTFGGTAALVPLEGASLRLRAG
jgi:hypothetical protein